MFFTRLKEQKNFNKQKIYKNKKNFPSQKLHSFQNIFHTCYLLLYLLLAQYVC